MTADEAALLAALKQAYQGDAIFRPSNASRWMKCPGSVQLIARLPRMPQKPSFAARQGTAAHTLAESVLNNPQGVTPEDFIGRYIMLHGDPTDTVLVDEEMAEKVGDYIGIVEGYRATPGTEIFVEHKLSLAPLDPSDPLLNECRGTADIVAVNREQRWIVDIDLKYGKGVPVAGDSPQPKIYLLMALLAFSDGKPWNWGGTTIYQPRLQPPFTEEDYLKPFIYKPGDIMGHFLGEVEEAMHAALGPDPKLEPAPEPSRCGWCEARLICPAAREAGLASGRSWEQQPPPMQTLSAMLQPMPQVVVGTLEQPRPPAKNGSLVLPSPTSLDPGEIANILNGGAMFEIWYEGVKHRAAQLLETGTRIPGWHLKPRTGNRRWAKPREVVEAELLRLHLKPGDIYTEPKMKSPKQIEDALPKLLKGAIEPLVERPPGQPTLVAGDDPQQTITLPSLTMPIPS